MSITDKENELFDNWNTRYSNGLNKYLCDGIVDEQAWIKSDFRVMYLLKEVNDCGSDFDERDYLKNYSNGSDTINSIIYWQKAIDEVRKGGHLSWSDIMTWYNDKLSVDEKTDLLKEIAVINVKKTTGLGTVDFAKFDAYYNRKENGKYVNKDVLSEHLALYSKFAEGKYKPNLVICGNTRWVLDDLGITDTKEWAQTFNGTNYLFKDGIIYLDFCHPNARIGRNFVYFILRDAISEILKKY